MARLKLETRAVTSRQWVMIVALAAILAGAIYWQDDGSAALDGAGAPPRAGPAARSAAVRSKTLPQNKSWPAVDLDAALLHDPFASILSSPGEADGSVDAAETERAEAADLLALRQDGVSMILQAESGVVAKVGDRKLRVGDVIGGYQVVAINVDGVVLKSVKRE